MAEGAASTRRPFDALRAERWSIRKAACASERGVVTAQHFAAAEAGAAVLAAGGNAVDAAVTAALALQVVEPWMTGLAACGYLLAMQPDGRVEAVEFTGRAPAAYDPDLYRPDPALRTFIGHPASVGEANVRGFTAACVPGCVRGFAMALARLGTIGFDRALAPAIALAEAGMPVDWHATLAIAMAEADLRADPGARAVFLPGGVPPEPGARLPLPALARTLRALADGGPDALHGGPLGERLCEDLAAGGSPVTLDDLAAYRARHEPARAFETGGKTVHVAGETSAGERLIDALAHFAAHRGAGPVDVGFHAAMAEACWHAFEAHRARLRPAEADAQGSTSQVNAVDAEGRMVAITFTLLNRFGARALSPSTGILLNNGMSWFDPRPDRPNSLRPLAHAPSNMCPVAISDADGSFAVMGASGGNQIVPCLAQVAGMMIHAGLDAEAAINAPRMSTGPVREIAVDLDLAPEAIAALAALGAVRPAERGVYPRPFASPAAIGRRGRLFLGMPDTTYPAAFAASPEEP